MYGMLFGQNTKAEFILATLGLTKDDVGRFRDCFVSGGEIAVYTRNGGGNRECWDWMSDDSACGECVGCTMTQEIPKHPNYLCDVDDDFDSTYATIYYSIPEQFKAELAAMDAGTFDPDQRWHDRIEALKGNA